MQTFMPYPDYRRTAACLDRSRLGNQRIEARTIIRTLEGIYKAWDRHPAVQMWKGFIPALKLYFNMISEEWVNRKYVHNLGFYPVPSIIKYPPWFGKREFHDSHKAALLYKSPEWYSQFGWAVEPRIEYWWPSKHSFTL
jgi:hypothetical protein